MTLVKVSCHVTIPSLPYMKRISGKFESRKDFQVTKLERNEINISKAKLYRIAHTSLIRV